MTALITVIFNCGHKFSMEKRTNTHVKRHSPLSQELLASACSERTSIKKPDTTHNRCLHRSTGPLCRSRRIRLYTPNPDTCLILAADLERQRRTAANRVREIEKNDNAVLGGDRERVKREVGRIWRKQLIHRLLSSCNSCQ